jgi:lysozyme family protein
VADFIKAYEKTAINEGGFANNPADSGGMTVFGIARKYWPAFAGWRIVDRIIGGLVKQPAYGTSEFRSWAAHVTQLLRKDGVFMGYVETFYKSNFWDKYRLDELNDQDLAEWLYDHIVNGGARGVQWMQEAADITADGAIGDESIRVFNGQNPVVLLKKAEIVAAWYRLEKAEHVPSQAQFLNSWLSRDGVDAEIIKQVREFARDGLTPAEVEELKGIIKADALGDIQEATA